MAREDAHLPRSLPRRSTRRTNHGAYIKALRPNVHCAKPGFQKQEFGICFAHLLILPLKSRSQWLAKQEVLASFSDPSAAYKLHGVVVKFSLRRHVHTIET